LSDESLERFFAVIPAGGIGSRLWPLSRASAPKFLHDLTGSGQTLLQDTWERLLPLTGTDRTMVVTGSVHAGAVANQLPQLEARNLILEPSPKDSAAAICLAAAVLARRTPGVIIGSFAADHVISGEERFLAAVRAAIDVAARGFISVIGIKPTEPSVAFGYIHPSPESDSGVRMVDRFIEKPKLEIAREYFASGEYLWNAGMFIAPASLILEFLKSNQPQLFEQIDEIAAAWDTPQRNQVLERVWPQIRPIAIDYAIAEPAALAGKVAVIEAEFDWHDVGDFAAIAELQSHGQPGKLAVLGSARVLAEASSGILVSDTNRLIALIGLDDIIVVDTPDALLVTTKDHAQQVKSLVDSLRDSGHGELL
jgi:mannose-1-phosphate guanylyltransferase